MVVYQPYAQLGGAEVLLDLKSRRTKVARFLGISMNVQAMGANDALCSRTAHSLLTTWLPLNLYLFKSPSPLPTPRKPLSPQLQT